MADWETSASNDGGAAAASFAETNGFHDSTGHTNGDTATEPLDMTPLAGALTDAEIAAHKARAKEAGWVDTIPVNYNQSTNRDDTSYRAESAVYEWDDDYGDVGPEVPELEEQLYHGQFRLRQGDYMSNLDDKEVTVEGPDKLQPCRSVRAHPPFPSFP